MSNKPERRGSTGDFDTNWQTRSESRNNYWTPLSPLNQLQLAFQLHWEVFNEIMGRPAGTSLEVGCGRGSLSSYFADNGWDTTLVDYSPEAVGIAREIFSSNDHTAKFICGDANSLPFFDDKFDAVTSIGLLEHFEDPYPSIHEQWRVLKPGGWVMAYIVPYNPTNLQQHFNWLNKLLKWGFRLVGKTGESQPKRPIYRNDYGSTRYLPIFEELAPDKLIVTGMYSLPMVSHSPEFPFSLLPAPMERGLTSLFRGILAIRRLVTGRHGWLCSEKYGQAFLIAARKKDQP